MGGIPQMAAGLIITSKERFCSFVRDIAAIANEKINDDMIPVVESSALFLFRKSLSTRFYELQRLNRSERATPHRVLLFGVVLTDVLAVGGECTLN